MPNKSHVPSGDGANAVTLATPPDPATDHRSQRPVLVIERLNKHFGDLHVLKDVSLTVGHGQVVVVIGPSGSGKSTLCRCINRLVSADSGSISVNGTPVPLEGRALAQLRSDVGMVFQNFNLFAHKTVLENVVLGPIKVRGIPRAKASERARALLDRVGIADKAQKYPAQLSGGQQQRAAIARALAMEPELMLFDEPTSALDPETIHEVVDVMAALARDGMTMVVVTHEMGFARHTGDKIVFMDGGQIVEERAPDEFFTSPSSARARDFLAKILNH